MLKKSMALLVLIFLIIGLFLPYGSTSADVQAAENTMMHESTQDIVKQDIDSMNISYDYIDDLGDFSANYVKDTYFAIEINGQTLYNQGYFITANSDGDVVFCLEPDVMIGTIESNTLSEGKYSELSDYQKARLKDIIKVGLDSYKNTGDDLYLVATQIRVWEEVGAQTLELSDNISEKKKELENLQSKIEENLSSNYVDSADSESSNSLNSEAFTSSTLDSQDSGDISLEESILEDSQSYEGEVEQYVTSGQDVTTVNEQSGFDVVFAVSDENNDDYVSPNEVLTYNVKISNKTGNSTDFLLSVEDYNKYLNLTEDDIIDVNAKSYHVTDLLSSNFVIENVGSEQSIEFSFNLKTSENYDGEIVKTKLKVCDTSSDGCVESETRIMGDAVAEDLQENKSNPYAKIQESNTTEDSIEVKVTGADVNSLLEDNVYVNLYLGDDIVTSKEIDFSNEEEEYVILFEDSEEYNVISNTKYTVKVEGNYTDYKTQEKIEGTLTDGSAQEVEATIDIETTKSGNEPEVGSIKVMSTLKELTSNSVKANISIDNPYDEEIKKGEILFTEKDSSDDSILVLTNDNISKLMDGEDVTIEQKELKSDTKYKMEYKFYDSSEELLASGNLGEIKTDSNPPSFTLVNDIFSSEDSKISGTVNLNGKNSILNLSDPKLSINLIEYDSSNNLINEEQKEFNVDDTTDSFSYEFDSEITDGNTYELSASGTYNVDNMFDKDEEEGEYDIVLKAYDSNGESLYGELTAIYNMPSAIIGSNSIEVELEIQNPENTVLNNLTTKVCKRSDLESCSVPEQIDPYYNSTTGKYDISLSGLESNTEYKIVTTAEVEGNSLDIVGVNDIFETGSSAELTPPKAKYSNVVVSGTTSKSLSATLEIEDPDGIVDSSQVPLVTIYTDNNNDGYITAGTDTLIGNALVEKQSGPFNGGKYSVSIDNLSPNSSYQFYTEVYYNTGGKNPIKSVDNSFSTDGLFGTYVSYDLMNTVEGENSISTEFKLVDEKEQANAIGGVYVYTDINNNGIVDGIDVEVNSKVSIEDLGGLKYSVNVTGLEPDTTYQLHNDISSNKDNKVYDVESENNVFKTSSSETISKSDYNLYVEPKENSINSYNKNTIGIEMSLYSSKLEDIQGIELNLINNSNILDKHVIELNNSQLDEIRKGESIQVYFSDLKPASSYSLYANVKTANNSEIIESEDKLYTDYEKPDMYITNKQINSDGFSAEFNFNDNSLIEDIKLIDENNQKIYDVDYSNNEGNVLVDGLDANKHYRFIVEYDYILDNESYLSTKTYTSEILFEFTTLNNDLLDDTSTEGISEDNSDKLDESKNSTNIENSVDDEKNEVYDYNNEDDKNLDDDLEGSGLVSEENDVKDEKNKTENMNLYDYIRSLIEN